jgi:septum formation protein
MIPSSRAIVLASASPRRRQLLEQLGLKFAVDPSGYCEEIDAQKEPREMACSLAFEKAHAIASRYKNAVIIAADTFGVFEGRVIGKPCDSIEANDMLTALSGRCHSVITGFCVLDSLTGRYISKYVETNVFLRKLTPSEITAYVKTGEPLDKAGAYAIQGLGASIVERIEGDFFNVVGLPLYALCRVLEQFDIRVLQIGSADY